MLMIYPFIFILKIVYEDNNIFEKGCRCISIIFFILTLAYMTGKGFYSDVNEVLFTNFGLLEMIILSWAYIFMMIEIKKKPKSTLHPQKWNKEIKD